MGLDWRVLYWQYRKRCEMKSKNEIELAEAVERAGNIFTTSGFVVRAVLTKHGTWYGCVFSAISGHIIYEPVTEYLLGSSGLSSIMRLRRWQPYGRRALTLRAEAASGAQKTELVRYGTTP